MEKEINIITLIERLKDLSKHGATVTNFRIKYHTERKNGEAGYNDCWLESLTPENNHPENIT